MVGGVGLICMVATPLKSLEVALQLKQRFNRIAHDDIRAVVIVSALW